MPYEWITPDPAPDAPVAELHLWPYRSLLRRDFVVFIAGTVAIIFLPLIAVLGSPVLWGLLPFFIIAVSGVWYALHRSYKDGEILEELRIWPDRMTLIHIHPRRGRKSWEGREGERRDWHRAHGLHQHTAIKAQARERTTKRTTMEGCGVRV